MKSRVVAFWISVVALLCQGSSSALLVVTSRKSLRGRLTSLVSRPIRRILYPNTLPDRQVDEPLPPGPLGCPFVGLNPKISSPKFGPGLLFYKLSSKLGHPRVFKFFSKNKGVAVVSGYSNTKATPC